MEKRADYTVFMTKGTHIVSHDVAMDILQAVRKRETDVTVVLQPYGTGAPITTTLIVSHIVSLMQHNEEIEDFDNVRVLRR